MGGASSTGAGAAATAGAVPLDAEGALSAPGGGKKQSGLQAMLSSMGELCDEGQYEAEFNVEAFMKKVGRKA